MWHIPFNTGEYIDFGGVITFAVEVWSWKLCQIKDPLVFDAPIRGSVNQNIALSSASKHRAQRHVVLTRSTARCFDSREIHRTADCGAKANGSLIWHNFQDQTSTAKVMTPP